MMTKDVHVIEIYNKSVSNIYIYMSMSVKL